MKRVGKRALRIALSLLLILQMVWVPNAAHAAETVFYFRGYNVENINSSTLNYATNSATVSGTSVTFAELSSEGEAFGLINLNESGHDISQSVDLGGLEIDFSTVSYIEAEGEAGADNDVPTATIYFCTESDIGSATSTVTLHKADSTVAGSETLSSGAKIPTGTRSIFLSLKGTSISGNNTVTYSNTSLIIHDSSAPTCSADYNHNWTNQDVTVTINAADSDAGLEGIYVNDTRVSGTSPYTFTVSDNNTSFTAYAMDLAGKKSDVVSETVDHIDKTTPADPSSVPLSSSNWTNADVYVLMPALAASTGSPERYVYQIGTSAWATLPDGFAITAEGNTTIRVAVEDEAGNRSAYAQATAKIDKSAPTISDASITSGSSSATVNITASDVGLSGLQKFAYAEGEQTADYFTTGGTLISGGTFTVSVGGTYTVYAGDLAGNTSLKTISITTAPTFDPVSDLTMDEDETRNIPLSISDAESTRSELTVSVTTTDDALLQSVVLNQSDSAISLDITPAANQSGGPVTVTVEVEDPSGQKVSRSFTVTVSAINDLPLAVDDSGITVSEDGQVEVDVLANDSDLADGDTLSIQSVSVPSHGTTLIVLGKVRYTPAENFAGTDSFTYVISDGNGGTAEATVYVTVTKVNDAPTAVDDTATATEDSFVSIDVLANDSDVDSETDAEETIALLSSADGAHGTTQIVSGQIVYTPEADFNGTDTFTYIIEDAAGLTAEATVTVTVEPEADAPRFSGLASEYTIDEDAVNHAITFDIYDVETPADSLMLQAASLDSEKLDQDGIVIQGLGDSSTAVSLLLSPVADQNGDVSIKLTLGDGFDSVEQTIVIHINNVNDAPRAVNDKRQFTEDVAYLDISIAGLLANDTDVDGDAVVFDGLASDPSSGTIELFNETTLRYTPVADYSGTTSFTYYVSDGTARTTATCTLEGIGVNDAPSISITETEIAGTEDTQVEIPFTISDNESAPADLEVIVASSDDNIVTREGITVVNNGDGTGVVQIMPSADSNGTVNITLTVSDGEDQASDSVQLVIAPTQDAPIAEDDLVYVHYSTSRTFSLLVNDHDIDGDALTVYSFVEDLPGTLTFDTETQMFTYVPAIGENGISTFTYTITDGHDTDTAIAELDVVSEMHNPVITSINSQYVNEDGTISGIAFSVSDEDVGDTATITVTSGDTSILPQDAEHITVTDLGSGNYTLSLTPVVDASGAVSVTVTVTDSTDLTDSASFTLHVIATNDAPIAVNDELTMNEDGALTLNLLANDSDPDGDTIWLSSLTWPSHGYIERTGNTYTYYPYGNWSGTETLTYTISDGRETAQASVTITVEPVNDNPVAWDDWREIPNTTGSESANFNVLGNDYDVDTGDVVRMYEIVTAPSYGTAVIEADGTITYTRNQISPLGNGADSFVYRIIDRETATGDYRSDTATVHIGVEFISTLYTYGTSVYCYEDDSPFNINLSVSNPTPVEYDLTINTTTTLGSFEVIDNHTVRFTPAPDQNGYAAITYTVEQIGGGESDTGTIWIRVYPVNDLPEITACPTAVTMDEDASAGASFDVAFHDPDIDTSYLYFYVYTQNATTSAPIPFYVSYSVTRTAEGATVTVNPGQNVNGTGTIIVGVSDGMTYTYRSIDLTVNPVDDAPVVNGVTRTINEDSSVTFASPGSDTEVDGDTVSFVIDPANPPLHGTATIDANHLITYVPDANYYGTETFYVLLTDQTEAALSSTGLVTIVVRPINDAPEIFDLSYYQTTLEDTPKDVTLTVSDVDNILTDSSYYTLTSEDQTLVKNENITISHDSGEGMIIHVVPEENAYGTVKINIVVTDGKLPARAAFSLKIVPVNDIPVAVDDTATVDEVVSTGEEAQAPKTTATINLLTNDSDIEDGKPSVVSVSDVVNGTVANIGGGKVLVTADGDFSGDVTFTYTVMDKAGATASANVTLTINPVNDPPRAKDDSVTILEDESPLISVLANDADPEGDTLSIAAVTTPAHGTATIDGTKVSYVPDQDYFGTDVFDYTVSDGNGGTATATVTITIKPVNDAPTINKHSSNPGDWTMLEDTTKAFNFVVADAESPVSNLIIKITSLDETLLKTTKIALTTNAEGYKVLTVTPVLNANGVVDVKITVSDGLLTTEAIYPITITAVNDAPVVTAPVQTIKEDTLLQGNAYATDAEGDSVTFAKHTDPAHGSVMVYEDGSYYYMPTHNYNGEDSFILLADDGQAENNVGYATVYITVKPDGDPPVAQDDSITIDEDTPTTIPVLDNDADEDVIYGDSITLLRVTSPAHGTAVIAEGSILYTPMANYNGTDTFGYTITDRDGKTDTATVSITITPVNDAPTGGDDTATVLEDHSVTINVTENDDIDETTNPDLEDVTVLSVDTPTHGTATISEDLKSITYTPNENWFSPEGEPEVFYYTAKDSSNQTERFAVSVMVTSVNDLPVITPATLPDVSTAEDTVTEAITFNVSDIETAAGSLSVTATHLNGVLLPAITVTPDENGDCSFTVLPYENKVGSATITVKVTDADGGEDTASFTLTVTAVNDVPRPGNDTFTVAENATYTKDVLANDDVDILSNNGGDTLTLLSIATPQYGTASIVNNKLYYVPDASRSTTTNYQDVFTYTMKDASGNECTPTVTVTVTPVNDAPTISAIADVTGVLEDAPDGTGDISFSVTDEEDDDDTLQISTASSNTTLFPVSNISITNPTDDPTGSLRTVKVIPAANQYGTARITLTVRDAQGVTATSYFNITVDPVNDVPLNGDREFTVVEDVEKQLDVLTGIDPDYATMPEDITITAIATQPSHGTVRIAADGKSLYYTTAQDSNEPDSFEYTIFDSYGEASYTFTVSITVTPVNDAPVIHYLGEAQYTIYEGTQQNDIPFTVTDVDNVTDASGTDPVEVTLSAKSSNSILLYNGIHIDTLTGDNRDIDLTPYLKWNGTTTVTITATDPGGLKSTASFVLVVNSVNDTPVAVNDTFSIPEDQTSSINVLANDTDDDLQTNPATEFIKVKTVTDNDPNATITAAADGLSVTVVPNANYNGPLSFTYTIEDSQGAVSNTATVNLTVTQVNDAPTVGADSATTDEDTSVDILVLDNDGDIDMQSGLNANPENESISVVITGVGLTAPSHGTITTDGTKITYTPSLNYNGTDTFDYYCSDGDTQTKGTVNVTITQVNDNPVAVANTVTTNEDTATAEVDVLANDTDVDTSSTTNQDVLHLRSTFSITAATVTDEAHGSVAIINNKLKFTPAPNWFGTEVVNYTMSDGNGGTASSTLTVTVNSVNDLPVFDTAPENLSLTEDGDDGVTTVVVSDIETAGADLVVTATNSTNPTLIATSDVTITAGADGTRTITVNPKLNQNGSATITLNVKDGNNANTTITFMVAVAAVNDAPVALDKTLNISEDAALQTVTKASLASDVDVATNADTITLMITTPASHGTAAIDADGNVTYVPGKDFNGTDTFVYTATDGSNATVTGTFTFNIAQVNDAPETLDDTATTNEDTAVDISVLANDSDVDMDETLNANPEDESISVVITGAGLAAPSHGTITTDGTKITYTPATNYNGTDTFDYYCSDGDTQTKGTVTVTIYQVNDNPVAVANTVTTNEDTATAEVDVLANDTDVDTSSTTNQDVLHLRSTFSITAATVTDEAHGRVEIINNKLKFTPALNWFGTEVVNYTMSDGNGGTASSTLTVTVNSVNDLPVYDTAPENLSLTEDGADGVTSVVVSDIETAAADLVVTATNSTNPTLIATSDVTITAGAGGARTITVNPKLNQNGSATITLNVRDGNNANTTITFNVTVAAVNDAPVALDKTLNISEDAALQTVTKASLASDVDVATNGDTITLTITTPASHGTAAIDASGNVTYIPNKDFNGADSFVYTATDGSNATDSGTFTINIAQVNDATETQDDTATTNEDTAVDINVLSNDSDVDMDETLNANPGDESISVVITGAGLTAPSQGTITTDGTKITYTPSLNYNGTDTFDYYCYDGDTQTKGTVTVTIYQVNDNPVANEDSATTDEDTLVSTDVLANDTDVDAVSSLNEDTLHSRSDFVLDRCYFYGGSNGTLSIDGSSILYTPDANFYGTQIIKYELLDGNGGTATGTLTVLVGSKNDAPVANPDEMSAEEDHTASVNVLTNDTDVDTGDTKTLIGFIESTSGMPGTFTTNANGDITFTPDANYNGSFDITYQMRDTAGLISSAKITITITPVNDAPVADDSSVTTNEDTPKTIDVSGLVGDADIETNDDVITVSVEDGGEPAHGTIGVSGNVITYTPSANFNGSDEITYTVTDVAGAKDTGKLSITVQAVNDAPTAVDDEKTIAEDAVSTIFVLDNDSDVDTDEALNTAPADAPYILAVSNGTHGTATTDGAKITYTPDENYNGIDTLTYVLIDGLLTDEASVSITITQVNDTIQAVDDSATTNDEEPVTIDVLANDRDVDTDTNLNKDALHLTSEFRVMTVGSPENGVAEIVSGKIVYTPDDRFSGADSFTYTVSDGHGSTASGTVTVTVLSVNDPPLIEIVSSPKDGDRAGTGSYVLVDWTGFDIDGDELTYTLEYFDGTSWHLISNNLTESTYEFAIPDSLASTNGLKFRVTASDSEYTSDYGYSGAMQVDKDAPTSTTVTMKTADGRAYTEGTWTNQTVTVTATSSVDASKVTYYYDMDGGASAAAVSMDVTSGVHTVNIKAVDEFGNTAVVGDYLARVDKQQPAEPEIRESVSGGTVVLTLTLQADPGGSGNDKLTLPDGTTVKATGTPTYAVTKNGNYNFTLTDIAGNRRAFTYTVSEVDTTKPVITLASGAYRIGTTTQDAITATLTYTDAESTITNRGYLISQYSTPAGSYRTYESALKISDAGTYYIHAYAKNAFGLTTYETFGPFIIKAAAIPVASPTPVPESGDVVITKEDVEEIPGDTVQIRLPGQEWSESLTLENVVPGTYLVEAMDADGNVRTVEVRVTMRDIFARSIRSASDNVKLTAVLAIIALAAIAFALLLSGYNITVVVVGARGGAEQKLRTLRRIKFRKKELIVKLEDKHLTGGEYCDFKVAKPLSKKMRGNTIVVTMRGQEVLREWIPDDFDDAFQRTIQIER
jgi:hypothetical protein